VERAICFLWMREAMLIFFRAVTLGNASVPQMFTQDTAKA
jgi:hypothetical protein